MPTTDANKALVARFWDDLYAHRFDALGAYFTDNAEYDDVPIPPAKVFGPAAIVRKLEIGFGRVPGHRHHLHGMVAEGETVITADDHVVSLPFVSVQVVRDGKIALWRDYSNMATLIEAAPAWWLEHVTSAWSAG